VQPLDEKAIAFIVDAVKPFTMVCEDGVRFTIQQTERVLLEGIPGHLIECGTWRGGCAFAMLFTQLAVIGSIVKRVYLFDSFQGLPVADSRDGQAAREWQGQTKHNCKASRWELENQMRAFGFNTGWSIYEGWFSNTLPTFGSPAIALLRLDSDWYESTKLCLEKFYPRVEERGTVIIDDYYAWEGCARALHEFLAANDLPHRIRALKDHSAAYFIKDIR